MKLLWNFNSLWFLILALLLSFHLLPGITTIGHDKQVFVYAGMAIWKGAIPYKDFFDHKPPLIFLITALAWPFKEWGLFFLGVITKWIAAAMMYRTASVLRLPYPAVYPVLFLVLILSPFVLMEGVLTREYAACFLVFLYSHLLTDKNGRSFRAGLLAALVFYTQQEELLPVLPLMAWYWWQAPLIKGATVWQSRWEHAVQIAAGFLMFSLPIFVWFTLEQSLYGFWHQTVSFNLFIYGSQLPLSEKIRGTISVLFHTRYLFLAVPFLLLHLLLALRPHNKALHLAMAGAIMLAVMAKATLGRIIDYQAIYHYMLTFSATLTVSLMVLVRDVQPLVRLRLRPWMPAVLVAAVFLVFWKNSFDRVQALLSKRREHPADQLCRELRHLKGTKGQLYVMGYTPYIYLYNQLEVLSPSPWLYVSGYRQELPFDPDAEIIDDITRSLDAHQTTWLVDFLVLRPLPQQLHQQKWESYLSTHYGEVRRTDRYILFKRNK